MDATALQSAGGLGRAGGAVASVSWWQVVGGLLAVFGLLVVALRLLARWQRTARAGAAALLAVLPLGPRREIQVLRLRDQVHYVYRQDNALLLLGSEPHAAYQAAGPLAPTPASGLLESLVGRRVRRDAASEAECGRERLARS